MYAEVWDRQEKVTEHKRHGTHAQRLSYRIESASMGRAMPSKATCRSVGMMKLPRALPEARPVMVCRRYTFKLFMFQDAF